MKRTQQDAQANTATAPESTEPVGGIPVEDNPGTPFWLTDKITAYTRLSSIVLFSLQIALLSSLSPTLSYLLIVIDSGASHHMFHERSSFLSLSLLSHPVSIKLGDGKTVIAKYGGFIMLGQLTVQALYVPAFKVSLISVSCLDTSGLCTTFEQSTCSITAGHNKELLFTGILRNGIYVLSTPSGTGPPQGNAHISCTSDLWHRRLGHINFDYIKSLLPDKQISHPSDPCKVCILATSAVP
jgi:hypothetical protein